MRDCFPRLPLTCRPNRTLPRWILGLLASGAVGLIGCDGSQHLADIPAQNKLAQAEDAEINNKLDVAQTGYDAAASMSGTSSELSARAHYLQANVAIRRASAFLDAAEDKEIDIARLLGQIRTSTLVLDSAQAQLKADEAYDPGAVIEKLQGIVSQAKGNGADSHWTAPGATNADASSSLLSLAGVNARIEKIKADIKANRDKAQDLTTQKNAQTQQGDDLQQKSAGEQGQAAVDDFSAGAQAHEKAANLSTEIATLDAGQIHLQADLDSAMAQQVQLTNLINDYTKQISSLKSTWALTQSDMEKTKKIIAEQAGSSSGPAASDATPPASAGDDTAKAGATDMPPPPEPKTLAEEADALKVLLTDSRDLRDKAADALKAAIKDFGASATSGDKLRSELAVLTAPGSRTPPSEKLSIDALLQAINAGDSRLAAAQAERTLGLNYAIQAMVGNDVKETLNAAALGLGASVPSSFGEALSAADKPTVDELTQLSEESFKDAMDHFDTAMIQTSTGPDAGVRKAAAMNGKMITAYEARQLSLALHDKPIAGMKPDELQAEVDRVAALMEEAGERSMLPPIPYTITPPSTQPATQPTVQ